MNTNVIYVLPRTSVLVAIDIIVNNNFNGVPVTDNNGHLVGIVTKYDLIVKRGSIRDDTVVGDVMNKEPLTLDEGMSVTDAINAFTEHHKVDPIPVIDADKKVIGIISRLDMVKLFREYGVSDTPSASQVHRVGNKNSHHLGWLLISGVALGAIVYYFFF